MYFITNADKSVADIPLILIDVTFCYHHNFISFYSHAPSIHAESAVVTSITMMTHHNEYVL